MSRVNHDGSGLARQIQDAVDEGPWGPRFRFSPETAPFRFRLSAERSERWSSFSEDWALPVWGSCLETTSHK